MRSIAHACRLSLALAILAAALPFAARAHDERIPVAGDQILILTSEPGSEQFQFAAMDAEIPFLDEEHDPAQQGASVMVRGVGLDGGRTPLIDLDRTLWTPIESGYQYSDPSGARGGITGLTVKSGEITITGAAGFPWSPAGAQDEVWVHLQIGDAYYCSQFPASSTQAGGANAAGHFAGANAANPGACPAQVCGDGVPQFGEQCDDGDLESGDGCESTCQLGPCNATSYPSTFEAIQDVVFDGGYGCTNDLCHDSEAPKNDLDLTDGNAYESLLGPNGTGRQSHDSLLDVVRPSEPDASYLYLRLLAKTFPNLAPPEIGTPMPSGGKPALSEQHLEAVRKWIRGGAPETGIVEGTADLLGTCLPPPTPLKIPVPPPPDAGMGVQLVQTPWPLPPTTPASPGEDEICMATYYDVSALVPESARVECPEFFQGVNNPSGDCFLWHRQVLYQDPQSHHSIVHIYTGDYDTTHTSWGGWTYKLEDAGNPQNGAACDPLAVDPATGQSPGCSADVFSRVACIGYGPPDASQFNIGGGGGGTLPTFSGSQEPYYDQELADGVYAMLPVSGIVVWNSHAFNLTQTPSTMAQYLELEFAEPADQLYPLQGIFMAEWIFTQDVPAFGTHEICGTYTIPQGASLFNLSSHTHIRGTRWRTWAPPNTPCQPGCPEPYYVTIPQVPGPCGPDPSLPICEGPRSDTPLYFSTDYSDPLQLNFDPPVRYDDPEVEDRTFLFCSRYDNGSTATSPPVKQISTTPMPPDTGIAPGTFLNLLGFGGPCRPQDAACLDGPNKGMSCGSPAGVDHALCGDPTEALCDACPVRGGVTTSDEMFILLGSYYIQPIPEPDAALLGAAAALGLGALARRRKRLPGR